jgi:hypothetical protein
MSPSPKHFYKNLDLYQTHAQYPRVKKQSCHRAIYIAMPYAMFDSSSDERVVVAHTEGPEYLIFCIMVVASILSRPFYLHGMDAPLLFVTGAGAPSTAPPCMVTPSSRPHRLPWPRPRHRRMATASPCAARVLAP